MHTKHKMNRIILLYVCFTVVYKTPINKATPNARNNNPDILLMMVMFLSVNFLRSLPARFIFRMSADIFSNKQMEKITTRSSKLFDNDLVAAANHSAITPGFNVVIKKPVMNNFAWVVPPILTPLSSSSLL